MQSSGCLSICLSVFSYSDNGGYLACSYPFVFVVLLFCLFLLFLFILFGSESSFRFPMSGFAQTGSAQMGSIVC